MFTCGRSPVPRERSPPQSTASTAPELLSIPPLPAFPSIPIGLGLPPNTPLPYSMNIAFMWSPSGNTLNPVLLLSDRLSDPNRPTLVNRLGVEDYMEINQAPEALSAGNFNLPGGQLTRNMLDMNASYQHLVMGKSTSVTSVTRCRLTISLANSRYIT